MDARKKRTAGDGEMLEPVVPTKRNNVILHQEFDTQDTMPINAQVQSTDTEYLYPEQSAYAELNQFSINIIGRDQEWMDPSSIKLYLKTKVTQGDGNDLHADASEIMTEPFFPATLFRDIKVEINGNSVPVSSYIPWRNYIGKLTTMSKQAATTMLAQGFAPYGEGKNKFVSHLEPDRGAHKMYYPRGTQQVEGVNQQHKDPALDYNRENFPAWFHYHQWVSNSPTMNFVLPIETDLTEQSKMFPPGKNVRLIFDRSGNEWLSLRGQAGKTAKIHILEAKLAVKFYKLEPAEHVAQLRRLAQAGTAKYPIIRKVINTPTISGGTQIELSDIMQGKIPRRVFVGFIRNDYMAGNIDHSSYLMENINLKELYITFDGVDYPKKHYITDFTAAENDRIKTKKNLIAYEQFKEATFGSSIIDPYLSYDLWEAGHTLFAFDLTPDQNAGDGTHYTPVSRQGRLKLHIQTAAAIQNVYNVIVYMEVNQMFEIRHSDGQVIVDY